jgi:hypothetical protein
VLLTAIAHHTLLRSFKIVAVEERDITSTASRRSAAPFNLRSFEISAVGKGPSGRSGAFLTPSPPGEKATARQDQTGQSSTDDRSRHRHGACGVYQDRPGEMSSGAVAHEMKHLSDIEWLPRHDAAREKIGAELTVNESISADQGSTSSDIVVAEQQRCRR